MGTVYLVGAGPGDPELLTRKALRLIQSANVVLHDSLVSAEILALIPATTERIEVGKRRGYQFLTQADINALLVAHAQRHESVVRLKGGDPLLFGRAAEEIRALRDASVAFEIVPGISAAFAAAAAAKISLTDRRVVSNVLFTTFSRSTETPLFSTGLSAETTVVVYMPGPDYAEVSGWLIDGGLVPETPCLLISKASQSRERSAATTIVGLATMPALPAPAVLLVGRAVAQRRHADVLAFGGTVLRREPPTLNHETGNVRDQKEQPNFTRRTQ